MNGKAGFMLSGVTEAVVGSLKRTFSTTDLLRNSGETIKGSGTRRTKGRKVEYRVHFKGRLSKEGIWVMEKFLSPKLIETYKVM